MAETRPHSDVAVAGFALIARRKGGAVNETMRP